MFAINNLELKIGNNSFGVIVNAGHRRIDKPLFYFPVVYRVSIWAVLKYISACIALKISYFFVKLFKLIDHPLSVFGVC